MPLFDRLKRQRDVSKRQEEEEEESDQEPEGAAKVEEAAGLQQKLSFTEPGTWVERMTLVASKELPKDLNPDDDPKREELFLQHALISAKRGVALLEQNEVVWRRPADFFAEMYKTDVHMDKIRQAMLRNKQQIEQRVQRRIAKEERKYGKEVRGRGRTAKSPKKTTNP